MVPRKKVWSERDAEQLRALIASGGFGITCFGRFEAFAVGHQTESTRTWRPVPIGSGVKSEAPPDFPEFYRWTTPSRAFADPRRYLMV